MPTLPETFDAILLGAGQTNNPLGRTLARGGWKVALIEKGDVGGTCANVGCTPTKAMIGCARVAHQARRGAEFGIHVGDVVVRLDEVRERTQGIVKDFRTGSERELAATNGLELIRGEGSFTGPRAVLVKLNDGGERRLAARVVVIDTGGLPARPDIPGLDSVPWLDSTGMLDLVEVPERLTVLGGGYIGLEYAQMFQRFGGRVTVLQKDDQLMSSEDPDMAAALAEILRGEGIEIHLNAEATRVSGSAGDVRVTYQTEGREREAAGTHLLVAVGRSPNTEALNLAAAGVETDDRGYIKVDEKLETNVPGVYAPGDVNGGPAFTQVAHNDNRILRDNLLRDMRVYATAFLRTLNAPILPFDYRATVDELSAAVARYQEAAGHDFGLEPTQDALEALRDALDEMYEAFATIGDNQDRRSAANDAQVDIARILVTLGYTRDGRFRQDPARAIPTLPALACALQLPDADPGFRPVLLNELRREQNAVVWELIQAVATVEQAIEWQSPRE